MVTGATIWETVTLAGSAERTRVARAFVAAVLDPGYPWADDAVLLVSEIFGNSVRHSRSGAPGETITVAVKVMDSVVRVEVTDCSGDGVPVLLPAAEAADGEAEGGRLRGSSYAIYCSRCNIPQCPVWARIRLMCSCRGCDAR